MNKLENMIRYGCGFLFAWPILFALKTTLIWIVWNIADDYIPALQGEISWFGAFLLCILLLVIRMGLNVTFNTKNKGL